MRPTAEAQYALRNLLTEKSAYVVGNNFTLINHDEVPGITNADKAGIRDVPSETLSIFDRLKRVLLAPDNQRWCCDLRQQVSELSRKIRVQCGCIAHQKCLAECAGQKLQRAGPASLSLSAG